MMRRTRRTCEANTEKEEQERREGLDETNTTDSTSDARFVKLR